MLTPSEIESLQRDKAETAAKLRQHFKTHRPAAKAEARARLQTKLGQLNGGIDPEMLMDGITLAGYYIEKGTRTFAAYAKAMMADLGDGAKPFLKSWYFAILFDPRAAGFDGMDSAADVESADVKALLSEKQA